MMSVATAIPAFIGYTEKAEWKKKDDLKSKPWRIESQLEYEQCFGYPDPEKNSLTVVFAANGDVHAQLDETKRSKFLMHYSLQLYFANGGGPCWITSVGNYIATGGEIRLQDLLAGLNKVSKIKEVTLLVFPDSVHMRNIDKYYALHSKAISQCAALRNRFTVLDMYADAKNKEKWDLNKAALRHGLNGDLKYAAAYFPGIYTAVDFNYKVTGDQTKDNDELVKVNGIVRVQKLSDLKDVNIALYLKAKSAISNMEMLLPVSAAVLGVYAKVDQTQGVWKAPANVNIVNAIRPQYLITDQEQQDLNVDPEGGKSINVIRSFIGRGPAIIWGARTLAGNDNEWRYVPMVRFFSMVEESVKIETAQLELEPNNLNTWVRLKSMIENYLTQLWKAGALKGATSKDAFFVHVGLGDTMTELDVTEGRMIVLIGMAAVRPAEFIMLRIVHKMLQNK